MNDEHIEKASAGTSGAAPCAMSGDREAALVARERTVAELRERLRRIAVELTDAEFVELMRAMFEARTQRRARQAGLLPPEPFSPPLHRLP